MEPIKPQKNLEIYCVVKQTGMTFITCPNPGTPTIGAGFYTTQREAEHNRTLELLKEPNGSTVQYHIFELTVPNPVYKET
jgi:hypothetical protein